MEIDHRIPVSQLPSRYGIVRSAVYTRLKDLQIEPVKEGRKLTSIMNNFIFLIVCTNTYLGHFGHFVERGRKIRPSWGMATIREFYCHISFKALC